MSSSGKTSGGAGSYDKVVRGKLTFKGEKPKSAHSLKSSNSGTKRSRDGDGRIPVESKNSDEDQDEPTIEILPGIGRITSSGTVIHGHFTEFMKQLSVGDAIIIVHPTT